MVTLLAGLLQAMTGFGFALIAAPLLMLVMNSKDMVVFNLLISTIVIVIMICQTLSKGQFKKIGILFAVSIIGTYAGTTVMGIINDDILEIFIGIVLILVTLAMNSKVNINMANHTLAKMGAGFFSGFLGATTSLGGPPVILYMMSQKEEKEVIRANLARFFLLSNIITIIMFYFSGNLQITHLSSYLWVAIPATLIGHCLGDRAFSLIKKNNFQRIVLGVVLLSAVVTICRGIWQIVQ
ncbi:sulfite exporter TauE/SafE family protein [Lucifera butyrica]|nr:sulfite exporter TauE/SafE family protein [Lucifera butyrica]